MATRTYLTFKKNNQEVLNYQIFGNNFWDDTFFTEISKLVGRDCFSECGEPDGAEVEGPFEEVFKLMEDVLVREINQYQTKLIEKHDFDNYIFENTYTNPLLDFTNNLVSREDKTNEEPSEIVEIVNEIDGSIEQVANETARNWKIGFSDTNNGMLVVININNHKIRTETSNSMSTYITDYETSILNNTVKYDFRNGDYDSGVNEYLDEYTKMMDRVVSGKEPMSHEEKYMRLILSFMIFVIVAGMIGVLLTKLAQIFSGGDDDDGYYGGGSSGSHYSSTHHHYYSGSSYSSRSCSSDSSSSSSSSSGWSGGGFGGGGSTGGW